MADPGGRRRWSGWPGNPDRRLAAGVADGALQKQILDAADKVIAKNAAAVK